jgi:hypothetical protein
MCGRVYIKATLEEMLQNFAFADRGDVGSLSNQLPRYNGAPSLYLSDHHSRHGARA